MSRSLWEISGHERQRKFMNASIPNIKFNFQDLFMLGIEEVYKVPLYNYCILEVKGEVDINKLNRAVIHLMDLHPVMGMRLKRRAYIAREPVYDFDKNIVGSLDLGESDFEHRYNNEITRFINDPINVWQELPFEIKLIRKAKSEYAIFFKAHHYVTDGVGVVCFISDLMDEYNEMLCDEEVPKKAHKYRNSKPTQTENRKGVLSFVPHKKLFKKHLFLKNVMDILTRSVNSIFSPSAHLAGTEFCEQGSINVLHQKLKPEDLNRLRGKSRASHVTLNDYFIAAVIMAIDQWNLRHGKSSDKISIELPVNLRPVKSFYKWVGNWLSSISISSYVKDRGDFETLLQSVSSQRKSTFENGLEYTIIYMTAWTRFLPFSIIKCLSKIQVGTGRDTAVLTILGNILRFRDNPDKDRKGAIEISNCIISGPVCRNVGCYIGIYLLKNEPNISFAYRDGFLTTEKAEEFLNLLVHWFTDVEQP